MKPFSYTFVFNIHILYRERQREKNLNKNSIKSASTAMFVKFKSVILEKMFKNWATNYDS